jgi:hypothetical protein
MCTVKFKQNVWSWGRGNKKGLEKKNKEKNYKFNGNVLVILLSIDIP